MLKGFQTNAVCWERFGNGLETVWKRFGNGSETVVCRSIGNASETVWKRFENGLETWLEKNGLAARLQDFISIPKPAATSPSLNPMIIEGPCMIFVDLGGFLTSTQSLRITCAIRVIGHFNCFWSFRKPFRKAYTTWRNATFSPKLFSLILEVCLHRAYTSLAQPCANQAIRNFTRFGSLGKLLRKACKTLRNTRLAVIYAWT